MSAHAATHATAPRERMLERVLRDYRSAAASPGALAQASRERAAARLGELGWPSPRDEQWRYANLRAFEQVTEFAPLQGTGAASGPVDELASLLPPPIEGFERLIFVDGVRLKGSPGSKTSPSQHPEEQSIPWPAEQRLGLLCDMFATDAARITVRKQAALEVLFVTSATGAGGAVYPRLEVSLAPGARLQLIERHLGAPAASTLVGCNVALELARGAALSHYRLQQCGRETLFIDTLAARVAEQAHYAVRSVAVGAGTARTSATVELQGRGASLAWHAIAVGRGAQVQDVALKVEHRAAETSTEELFRGIADEQARLAFSGHIRIDPAAPGARARQSLRGLIEGPQAELDLRPRLEILTDEVQAQHGATTGRLDEDLLFYLLARGIDRATARALLKWAFLGDVLRVIELPRLRAEAEQLAAGQLSDHLALIGALA